MSKWAENFLREKYGYALSIGDFRIRLKDTIAIAAAARKATLNECAALCDKHEDECAKDPMCHAHDAEEIRALLDSE